MKSITTSMRRGLAAGVAGALTLGAVAVLGSPAHAVDVPVLTWNVSTQAYSHMSTHTAVNGAFDDEVQDVFGYELEKVTRDQHGTIKARYNGEVNTAFAFGGTTHYSVNFNDPHLVVEADGDGYLTAQVNSVVGAAAGQLRRVKLVEFNGATVTDGVVTATPDFDGVLPADSPKAVELGAKAGFPTDGASFEPEFLSALASTTRGTFWKSGSSSDAKKAPGVITAELGTDIVDVVTPTVTHAVTGFDPEFGYSLRVKGANFTAVTNPGDDGVYVSVAPADAVVDFSDRAAGTAATFGTQWIDSSRIVGGAFDTVLTIPADKVEAGTEYVLLTWQAHTYSNDIQDTRTVIDWTVPAVATTTTLSAQGATLAATLTAKVSPAAEGKVTFKEGSKTLGTVNVVNGTATLKLAGLTGGTKSWTAAFVPADAASFKASTSGTAKAVVAKAASKTTLKVTKKATKKKAGKVKVTIKGGSLKATGKAKVTIKAPGKKAVVKKVTLKNGTATVALTKAKKSGTYKVTVTYAGDSKLKSAKKKSVTFKVKK